METADPDDRFAPLDHTAAQLLFRLVSAAYERRCLAVGSHWPFDQWGRFLPEHTTAVSLLDRLLLPRRDYRRRVLPDARGQDERRTAPLNQLNYPRGGDFQPATSGDRNLAVDTHRLSAPSQPTRRLPA